MTTEPEFPVDTDIRRRAEERLRTEKPLDFSNETEVKSLILRLLEHQIQVEDFTSHYQEIETNLLHVTHLFQNAPVPFLVLDKKGIIIEINEPGLDVLSGERENILNRPLESFVADTDHNRLRDFLAQMLDIGTMQSCGVHVKQKDTTALDVRCIGTIRQNPQNKSHEWCIVLIDNRLCGSSKKQRYDPGTMFLADLIEHSSHPFAVAYPNGQIRVTNSSFETLLGYSSEELAILDWARDITPEKWKEHEMSKLKELLRTGQPVQYEKEYIRKDGTLIPVELFVHLVSDAQGTPQYYYSFISDISDRKQTELKLKESEERFYQLANNVDLVFWFTSLNPEQVLFVNPSFERIWGLPAQELYKNPRLWSDHIHSEDKNRTLEAFSSWIEGKTPVYDIEYCILNRMGQIRWIHDRGAAIVKKDGVVVQVSGIAEDVTHLKLENISH